MRRFFLLPIAAVLLGAPGGPGAVRRDAAALAVIDLTRETRGDFIVVSETTTEFEGKQRRFPSAEFHSGKFHRYEEAEIRVVANCESRGGHRLNVPDNIFSSSPDEADRACGIAWFDEDAPVRLLGKPTTRFGPATRLRVTYDGFIRTYDVLGDGAIIRNEWRENKPGGATIFLAVATEYCSKALPARAFTRESLRQSNLDRPCRK